MTDNTPANPLPPASTPPWWFSSPIVITAASAIFGLLGTGVGVLIQGHTNATLEREKFEFGLIQKAVDNPDRQVAARNLLFLVQSGVITSLNAKNIATLAEQGQVPDFSVQGKRVRDLGSYFANAAQQLKACRKTGDCETWIGAIEEQAQEMVGVGTTLSERTNAPAETPSPSS